ncbi:hypothetical protein AC578_1279 [Pseudocercospora eumusae]|uniref:Uncharacterized protein n=1 Tax=Pseudocercospora eumusae TaxID=321146 RepID=A0A139HUI0_9PEZI|nr:hypothetical protein AC578_1279 [Pseudocercospora eumusae]
MSQSDSERDRGRAQSGLENRYNLLKMVVNTVLFCNECERNLIMRGKGGWLDVGRKPTGSTNMTLVNITICYKCRDPVAIENNDQCLKMDELADAFDNTISGVRSAIDPVPIVYSTT